jgi:hypothetical protein
VVTVKVLPFTALTVPKTPDCIPACHAPPFAPSWIPPPTAPTFALVCANAGIIIAKLAATPTAATHEIVFIIFIGNFYFIYIFIYCYPRIGLLRPPQPIRII